MFKKFSREFIKFALITKFWFSRKAPALKIFVEHNYENQEEFEYNLRKVGWIEL